MSYFIVPSRTLAWRVLVAACLLPASAAAQRGAPRPPPPAPAPPAPHVEEPLAPAVAGGLTSADVLKRALATSYTAQASAQTAAAVEARADAARLEYLPTLTLTASYTRLSSLTPPTSVRNGVETTAA